MLSDLQWFGKLNALHVLYVKSSQVIDKVDLTIYIFRLT